MAFGLDFTVLGSELGGKYFFAFLMASPFGVLFQYFAIAPMRGLGLWDGLVAEIKVDSLSILGYEAGLSALMAARTALYQDLQPPNWSCWLMMQVAMIGGFVTTYPVNWWLIRRGTKEKM